MLTCVVCMRACMPCRAREKERKRAREVEHGATPEESKAVEQHARSLPSCSLALLSLLLSPAPPPDMPMRPSLKPFSCLPLALHMRALSTKTWLLACAVDAVDSRYTHTSLSEDCVCSLGRVCRRRRCLHATYSSKSAAQMALDAILTTHSLVWR